MNERTVKIKEAQSAMIEYLLGMGLLVWRSEKEDQFFFSDGFNVCKAISGDGLDWGVWKMTDPLDVAQESDLREIFESVSTGIVLDTTQMGSERFDLRVSDALRANIHGCMPFVSTKAWEDYVARHYPSYQKTEVKAA